MGEGAVLRFFISMSWQTIVTDNNLNVSSVDTDALNEEHRLDAEYYQPQAIEYSKKIARKNLQTLNDVAKFVVGPFGSTVTADKYVDSSDYSYIRNLDIHTFVVNDPEARIPKDLFNKLGQFHVKENDLLVTVVGTLGKVGIARKKDETSIFSCKSTIVRATSVSSYYLLAYLNSRVGQTLLLRCKRGAIQEGLNLYDLKTLILPIPSEHLQEEIELALKAAIGLVEKASENILQAENSLINELGLSVRQAEGDNISLRKLSDCKSVSRFDAEYWQKDYDKILEIIRGYKLGTSLIGNQFEQVKATFKPDKQEDYRYIEIGDLDIASGDVAYTALAGAELPANARIKFHKRQLITSKVRPNRGATAILDNHEGFIGTAAFTVLTGSKEINLETLMVYLRLPAIRHLLLKYNTGTSYPVITDSGIINLPIPLVAPDIQKNIAERMKMSVEQRSKALELLGRVKKVVEIFVAEDEETALHYMASHKV